MYYRVLPGFIQYYGGFFNNEIDSVWPALNHPVAITQKLGWAKTHKAVHWNQKNWLTLSFLVCFFFNGSYWRICRTRPRRPTRRSRPKFDRPLPSTRRLGSALSPPYPNGISLVSICCLVITVLHSCRGFTGLYWALLGFTGFYWVTLLGSYFCIIRIFHELNFALLLFTRLLSFILFTYSFLGPPQLLWFYWVLLGFLLFHHQNFSLILLYFSLLGY